MLASDLQVPPVSQTSVHPDFLHALDVLSELSVQVVGGDLLELSVLDVFSSVEEPLGEAVAFWLGDDLGDLGDFIVGEFSSTASGGAYRLKGSILAFLQRVMANLLPTPLIALMA